MDAFSMPHDTLCAAAWQAIERIEEFIYTYRRDHLTAIVDEDYAPVDDVLRVIEAIIGSGPKTDCICPHFSDTSGWRIADLCCPVHGPSGSNPKNFWKEGA